MPLKELFVQFIKDVTKLRNESLDVENLNFHKENELRIKGPKEWGITNRLVEAIEESDSLTSTFVFYSNTPRKYTLS